MAKRKKNIWVAAVPVLAVLMVVALFAAVFRILDIRANRATGAPGEIVDNVRADWWPQIIEQIKYIFRFKVYD